jgi:magnesium chelatase family protein
VVNIVRARAQARFPARFALVAAMNPCPCGRRLDRDPECTCSDATILNYQRRISGPLLDRIDLHVTVPPVTWGELASPKAESSVVVRERVLAARERHRDGCAPGTTDPLNDAMLGRSSIELLRVATDRLGLSARGVHRAVRVARTIACLDGSDGIAGEHIAEAIRYRAPAAG